MRPELWRQIEELYHQASDCGPGERTALLARADPAVRQQVERLLAQEGSLPALDRSATVTAIAPGVQLGPYRIDILLGEGGMGQVFRATDTQLDRTVAIKVLPGDSRADADRKRRFIY